jgi:anthranilate synthase/aminodeoxychorismate synthase-like glutamine amidotransferase
VALTLVVDNYDSFTYNLVQMLGARLGPLRVVRNDQVPLADILAWDLARVIISPGPGRPEQAGISVPLVQALAERGPNTPPILGVCLGHQAIARAFGGRVGPAVRLMHGKADRVWHQGGPLFQGVPNGFWGGRYHSLAVEAESLKGTPLEVVATADDGTVMAIAHRQLPVFGIQFHPESILTPEGPRILDNFLAIGAPAGADAIPGGSASAIHQA